MTTTVDIPEEVLKRAIAATGARSAEEAVLKAVELVSRHDQRSILPFLGTFNDEFCSSAETVEPGRQAEIIQYLGKLDGFLTQQELREMRDAE